MTAVFDLRTHPAHLGLGATVTVQETFTGAMEWYQRYGERTAADGIEGRLVSMHTFSRPWDSWEMHPKGAELVVCVSGRITFHQELGDHVATVELGPGQALINPPGVWHTADASAEATALFITAGVGTQLRPRGALASRSQS